MSSDIYYNINDYIINENESVDAGSMWERKGSKIILVDEDCFIEVDFDENLFIQ